MDRRSASPIEHRRQDQALGLEQTRQQLPTRILVHRARSVAGTRHAGRDPLRRFALRLASRAHPNIEVCILANKIARIASAVLRSGSGFEPGTAPNTAAQRLLPAKREAPQHGETIIRRTLKAVLR